VSSSLPRKNQHQLEGDVFDEFRIGLDHIAFGCASREELESWPARLDALGIEHGEILDRSYGSGLAFRDPDNIQLDFFLPIGSQIAENLSDRSARGHVSSALVGY
jgi:hypothetical protein